VTFFRHVIRRDSTDTVTQLSYGCTHAQANYGMTKKKRFLYKIPVFTSFRKQEIHKKKINQNYFRVKFTFVDFNTVFEVRKFHFYLDG
jgi:hypothetical protein